MEAIGITIRSSMRIILSDCELEWLPLNRRTDFGGHSRRSFLQQATAVQVQIVVSREIRYVATWEGDFGNNLIKPAAVGFRSVARIALHPMARLCEIRCSQIEPNVLQYFVLGLDGNVRINQRAATYSVCGQYICLVKSRILVEPIFIVGASQCCNEIKKSSSVIGSWPVLDRHVVLGCPIKKRRLG